MGHRNIQNTTRYTAPAELSGSRMKWRARSITETRIAHDTAQGGATATGNDNLGATRQTYKEFAGRLRNGSRSSAEQRSAPRP